MKKVLSILLACVMAFSMLSVLAFAAPKDAVLEISIEPTQQSYSKGDVVKFEVFYTSSSDLKLMGSPFKFSIGFDGNVYESLDDWSNKDNYDANPNTFIYEGYPIKNNIVTELSWAYIYGTEKLTSVDTAKGWNSVLYTSMTPTGGCDDSYATKTASFAFQLKIKDNAPDDGCYKVGVTDYSIQNYETEINEEVGSIAGPSGPDYEFACSKIFETIDADVTIAAAAEPTILTYGGAQIRFDDVDGNGTYADHKDGTFDVRTIAKIAKADFDATFGGEEAAMDKDTGITDFGFVYAAKSNVPDFKVETAQQVAMGTATDANYRKKSLTYMQRTDEGYVFTCVIDDIKDADVTDGVNCLAYVKYGAEGKYIFFNAAGTADYTKLHERVPGYTA